MVGLPKKYKPNCVSYMHQIQGKRSRTPYFFDLRASYEQEYFNNLLFVRVVDGRVCIPTDYIKTLPTLVQDINGDISISPAAIRDHDLFCIVQTGKIDNSGLVLQTVRTIQDSYDVFLPRVLYFTEEEIENLLMMEKTKATAVLTSKMKVSKPFRG